MPYIHYIDEADDEVLAAKQLKIEKKPRGFIFLGGSAANRREELKLLFSPAVFAAADARDVKLPNVSSVSVDDRKSAQMAVDELLRRGHRQMAVLGGSLLAPDLVASRHQGVLDSFAAHGLTFARERYFECKFSLGSAYRATNRLLYSGLPVTALFCMSDIMAIGAAKAIHDRGLSIPRIFPSSALTGWSSAALHPLLAIQCGSQPRRLPKSVEALMASSRSPRHITVQTELLLGQSISTGYRSDSDDIKYHKERRYSHA